MRKWITRIGVALLALPFVLALAAFVLLRGSLPTLEGDPALPGLSAPVAVARDGNGTVTIDAANEADAMRALGYVHAQERFFEMDLMRRSPAGELSALFGKIALDVDRKHRLHRMRARVAGNMAAIAGDKRAVLDAYVAGANAGVAALPIRPWPYLLLRQQPAPWTAQDTPLAGIAMYFDLQDASNARELALWRIQPHLPAALFALLTRDGTRWDAPLQGEPRGDAILPDAAQVDLRMLPFPDGDLPTATRTKGTPGSNNFAVAGSLTADGRAIVANDMHLGLRAPNLWFRVRLRYADPQAPGGRVDVQGVSLPGLPAIIVGSNGHVAWGFTNSYGDYLDWQRQRPCGGEVVADCATVVRHREMIDIAGGDPLPLDIDETAWGPIAHRNADGTALALRWTAHDGGGVDLGITRLAHAADAADALRIADNVRIPTQNLMLADAKGQIAWRLLGLIPRRDAACVPATVDAQASCGAWGSASDASATIASPARDRLWTANARVVDGEALREVGDGGYAFGARAKQIRDGLQAKQHFDERDLLAIQLDDRALLLQPWWELLQAQAKQPDSPALAALAKAAGKWEGRASVESVSYRIVRAWRLAVHDRIADGLTAPARVALGKDFVMPDLPQLEGVVWPLVEQRPAHLLSRRYASWDALLEDAARSVATNWNSAARCPAGAGASATPPPSATRWPARCPSSASACCACRPTRCPATATCHACRHRRWAPRSAWWSHRAVKPRASSTSPGARADTRCRRSGAPGTRTGCRASPRRCCRDARVTGCSCARSRRDQAAASNAMPTASSACATSASRSAVSSSPQDSRTSPSPMPAAARSSGVQVEWVMLAGCCASDSASPRLTAQATIRSASMKRLPASMPPCSSSAIIPPGWRICRCATACCGCEASPG